MTKGEAKKLGWESKKGNLSKVAPGKSIGGDIYKNREKRLPEAKNRVWREADINYTKGYRGNDRLLYSNDGLIYKTTDHYKTFVKLK
ncbi:ribonuclease domain-containing protein [Bacillus subtilis]